MQFLDILWLGMPVWIWLTFLGAVLAILAFDLGVPIVNLGRERNQRARCDHDENDLAHACSPENPSSDGARR